ncbi:hypothetical protein FNV43_RR18714 [Rhamnella rubrinervis]|uniref:Uncharacterized protein n=1 Tax=Rhamnella rubrinervis TaxID=2594499 RepID=A0A8K0E6T8_9ROSA|nr:hypothetical protein FNV43_RR18714 [Rhamnella rubrinervis]
MSTSRSSTNNIHGSFAELFSFECAALVLMDYDKEGTLRFLHIGEFMINLIMHGCLLMMMNGHDSGDHLDQTAVMMCVCMAMRSKVEQIAHATLSQLGHIPGRSPFSVANQNSGMLKVIRMSTTSKIIGNIILSSSLKAIRVHIQDTIGTARPKPAEGSKNSFAHCDHQPAAYSSISVFTDLVEAVEIAWAVAAGHSHLLKEKTPAAMSAASSSPRGFKAWRLNR